MTAAVRILVVDDSPAVRQVLSGILCAIGCEVAAADGVRAALRRLRAFQPDLILTDFNMPGLDGEAFVRLARRHRRVGHVPILVVSSEVDVGIQQRMAAAGSDAWLGKPLDVPALVEAICAVVARSEPGSAGPVRGRDTPDGPAVTGAR